MPLPLLRAKAATPCSASVRWRTLIGKISTPSEGAMAWMTAYCPIAAAWEGSQIIAARVVPGTISLSSSSHLLAKLYSNVTKPVALPPGRDRLLTKPEPTASGTLVKTIGTVRVICSNCQIVVQMISSGSIMLGNLTIDVSRASGYYPDIVMGGLAPLQQLLKLGVVEPPASRFSKNRGRALVVRRGNPLGIHSLADVARTGARIAQADSVEAGARNGNRAAVEALVGKATAEAVFAREVEHFPGRLGITHRDVPEMIARGYADVGLTQYHLISYWVRTFPNHFELVPITGSERFALNIGFGRVVNPLRPRAARAFEEFLFSRAREVYPKYDFARMSDEEYGAPLMLN